MSVLNAQASSFPLMKVCVKCVAGGIQWSQMLSSVQLTGIGF